jgi:cobalt/nickel transport system ATP-binding protein
MKEPSNKAINPLITVDNVIFSWPEAPSPLLNGINLEIYQGQNAGIYGSIGSGKTTLFRIIVGLLKPQEGTIRFEGITVDNAVKLREMRIKCGLLFQDPDNQLFCPTVLEDVAFGPLNMGLSQAKALEKARQALTQVGLSGFEDRITHKLSGGEKKLAALAGLLAMEPKVILLDEPLNNLDEQGTTRLLKLLDSLSVTWVIISHNQDFLKETTDHLYQILQGKIIPSNQ